MFFSSQSNSMTWILLLLTLSFAANAEIDYEPNNSLDDAKPIFVNDFPQAHKFDYAGDEDWLAFYATEGTPYEIEIESESVGQGIDPALELYDEYSKIEVENFNYKNAGEGELLSGWSAPANGFYYIRVTNKEAQFTAESHYKIKVFLPLAPNVGKVRGAVIDRCTQKGIDKATLRFENGPADNARSHKNGMYSLYPDPGLYTITASQQGYKKQSKSTTVEERKIKELDFELIPESDCPVTPVSDQGDLEQLKQQAVGIYDDSSRVLIVKEIRVGNEIVAASLIAQEDFSFILASVTPLTQGISKKPAFYNFDTLLADIPQVFAFDKLYKVQLKQLNEGGVFILKKADPIP